MSTVIAAHVRSVDPPQFVAETVDELLTKVGQEWSGEQCDNCGNSLYIIRRDEDYDLDWIRRHRVVASAFYVECTPDADFWADNGQEIPEGVGCGSQYWLRRYDESEVTF